MDDRTLSYKELAEIDQLYSRANSIRSEAHTRVDSYAADLAVRRSQEAVEIYVKTIFRLIGKEYPRSHDLEKAIHEVCLLLDSFGVNRQEVARTVLANSTLVLWRAPSFYGDERLGVARVFGEKEAKAAVGYADEVSMVCEKVRSTLYRRAASAKD
ncbi:MAG: HEPN domain-containing protein [Vicinamibacteria bacterium]